jgi:hypothetical protein
MELAYMTKEDALHYFMSHLGLTAYQENAVPTGEYRPAYPYLTYEVATGSWDEQIPLAVSLWYRSTSWAAINAMAQEIADSINAKEMTIGIDLMSFVILKRLL